MKNVVVLKHFEGPQPGKRKPDAATTNESVSQSEKCWKYEKECRPDRTFNQSWTQGCSWLKYDKDSNVMMCTVCTEYSYSRQSTSSNLKRKHLFISGCNNFRLSAVTDHEKSKGHIEAYQMKLAKDPDQTEGHRTLIKLNEGIQKQVINKFRNIHALRLNNEIELEIDR